MIPAHGATAALLAHQDDIQRVIGPMRHEDEAFFLWALAGLFAVILTIFAFQLLCEGFEGRLPEGWR